MNTAQQIETNQLGLNFIESYMQNVTIKNIVNLTGNWFYLVTDKCGVISMPYVNSGCAPSCFGDENYFNKYMNGQHSWQKGVKPTTK